MRQIINKNERKFFTVEGETIDRLLFRFDSDNDVTKACLANIRISIYTMLDGVKQIKVTPEGMKLNDLYDVIFANDSERGDDTLLTRQISDVTPAGWYVLPFKFGSPLNLTKGKTLYVEVDNGGDAVNPADAFSIEVVTGNCIGVQHHVPQIERVILDGDRTEYDEKFGNNVFGILSKDLGDIRRVQVISDKANYEADETQIRSQIYDLPLVETSGDPNYPLYLVNSGNVPLNNVRLKLDFDAASSRTLFVVRKITSPEMLSNFVKKAHEHQAENIQNISALSSVQDM